MKTLLCEKQLSLPTGRFIALTLDSFVCCLHSVPVYCFVSQFIHHSVTCFMSQSLSPFILVN